MLFENFLEAIWKFLIFYKMFDPAMNKLFPIALHSIRSLLCTATNNTPHERMFTHQRRAGTFGGAKALLTCLTSSGKVFLRNFERSSKISHLVKSEKKQENIAAMRGQNISYGTMNQG